ncbi:methyltransferase domain-containing protein [Patescibacteria group bacterium]|nr:methyltransferase domain-containing protein [Patescibacteria group bacterium]MCG2694650.1 methyltransferase domain-containing protein [Candidatus Parcubacteria bacterium]
MSFADPKYNIEQFGLSNGMIVADLGSGSGFYTIESSRVVGSEGRVYAVDVQKDFLDKIRNSANLERLYNIEIILGDIEKVGGTRLADMSVDAVIVSNVLFQAEDRESLVMEAKRILRSNGRILVVDWADSFNGMGPDSKNIFSENEALKLFEGEGFIKDRNISAGDHHYGIVFRKK